MQYSEVKHQPEAGRVYLGSPSIVRLPDQRLLATHDYFGPGCPRNHEDEEALTSVYRSEDDGASWYPLTHVINCFWAGLFVHGGAAYLLGTSQQYGSIVIRRSDDGGATWTMPLDESSGLLFRGGSRDRPPNYHCAPMPVVEHHGRLYRAFEDCTPRQWGRGFQALVISAAADADLLEAGSWRMSTRLPFDPQWVPAAWGDVTNPGWLEGNVVPTPDDSLVNVLRFNSAPLVDRAALVEVQDEGRELSFAPDRGFVDFPGGMTKFTIRRDPITGSYLALCNNNTDPQCAKQRNILSLCASGDLRTWQVRQRLLEDETALDWDDSLRLTGFQYVDWQLDGEDLIYLVRMAYRGAHTYHDSNRITFHRLRRFRRLLAD